MKYLAIIDVCDEKSCLTDKVFKVIKFSFDKELVFDLSCIPGSITQNVLEQMIERVSDPEKSATEIKELWDKK